MWTVGEGEEVKRRGELRLWRQRSADPVIAAQQLSSVVGRDVLVLHGGSDGEKNESG